jgi:hypothetical protein
LLVNLTNDGWFGQSAAQWQHLASAALRAVENGVPLLRCCNNGITCWFDATGAMREMFRDKNGSEYGVGFANWEIPFTVAAARGPATLLQSRRGSLRLDVRGGDRGFAPVALQARPKGKLPQACNNCRCQLINSGACLSQSRARSPSTDRLAMIVASSPRRVRRRIAALFQRDNASARLRKDARAIAQESAGTYPADGGTPP